jgi:hypothetical protein
METAIECSLCGSVFSTKYNLTKHLKLSKKCRVDKPCEEEHQCSYCDYVTSTLRGVKIHEYWCKSKEKKQHEKEIIELKSQLEESQLKNTALKQEKADLKREKEDLKQEIVDLKLQLAEKKGMLAVKSAPKTVHNNYVNQKLLTIQCATIDPLTVDTVKKSVDGGNYTFQHFKLGPDGIVDFISDIICTEDGQRNYACSDVSRNKCHRLIETREWQSDTFINKILDQLKEPAIAYNKKVIEMWKDADEQEAADALREKTRDMITGITNPKSTERKDLFTKVRVGVKKLAAI